MRNRASRRRTVTAIATAVAVCFILFAYPEKVQGAPPQVAILVATHDIQIAEPITPSMVQVVQVPQGALLGPAPAASLSFRLCRGLRPPALLAVVPNRIDQCFEIERLREAVRGP